MVLVDSSVWIEYFKGNEKALPLNGLIDTNSVFVNDLILAELLPFINQKKEKHLSDLLLTVSKVPLEINWNNIIYMQTQNLKNGINKVGIADLIIAQNARVNNFELFTFDQYFKLMSSLHDFRLFSGINN